MSYSIHESNKLMRNSNTYTHTHDTKNTLEKMIIALQTDNYVWFSIKNQYLVHRISKQCSSE